VGGVDLVAKLESMIGEEGKIGGEGEFINEHAYAMIALSSVQRPVPAASVDYLLDLQLDNGSWSWNGDMTEGSGDNNTAAMAVVALIATEVPADHAQIQKTLALFHEQQNEDGGFPYVKPSPWGTDSDANSTAVVIWALLAAGEDPAGMEWKYEGQDGHSALDRLRAFQNESGAFHWQESAPDDNFASTVQAAVAMELETLPLATMNVGAPQKAAPATGEPTTLPETGVNLWMQAVVLLGGGIALMGAGLLLRRRL
jgi:LPXTG-motif cell wall-anchored protein